MAINKVVYGGNTLVDLTSDTVKPEVLTKGYTAHGADGKPIIGTMDAGVGGGGFPNGRKWVVSNIGAGVFRSVTNGDGLWVAGGVSGYVYYSEDGKTWTQSSSFETVTVNDVLYVSGIWVIAINGDALWYSEDGKNWTRSNLVGNYRCQYQNGIFVAGAVGSSQGVYYSEDGKTWTVSNITDSFHLHPGIPLVVANRKWIATGNPAEAMSYCSEDGKTWTQMSEYFATRIAYHCGVYVAGTTTGAVYSYDLTTWHSSNLNEKTTFLSYAKGRFYMQTSNKLYLSYDGIVWTALGANSKKSYNIIYKNGIFICQYMNPTSYGKYMRYSYDGVTFLADETSPDTNEIVGYNKSIDCADGIWVTGSAFGLYYSVAWEPS